MKKFAIQVSSGSTPLGLAPFFVRLDPFSQEGSKRYESKEDLGFDITECVPGIGFDKAFKMLAERPSILIMGMLTPEHAIRLGSRR